jgi:hypothetical protein
MNQDEWLNLSIKVVDIDGDVERGIVSYSFNITERGNLYFYELTNQLIFNPKNADVGVHHIEIKITDNNETPIQYISQKIKINVLNVNDPPTVRILEPAHGIVISAKSAIKFSCEADDIDLLIPDSKEKLSYRWYAETPEIVELGTERELINPKLPVGQITVTIEVKDSSGATASESIQMTVKAVKSESSNLFSGTLFWLAIILAIITAIVLVLWFMIIKKRRRRGEAARSEVTKPEVVAPSLGPSPYTGAPLEVQPAPEVLIPVPQAAPEAQLPATTTPPKTYTLVEKEEEITPQEKLELLEHQLLKGKIDGETYKDLKAKIEEEIQAAEPDAQPQLPPGQIPTETTSESVKEAEAEPEVVPSVISPVESTPSQTAPPAQPVVILESHITPQGSPAPITTQPPQASQPSQPPSCATCGQSLKFIEQYDRYYCYSCQKYG